MQQLFADLRRIVGANAVITDRDALRTYDADASMVVSHAPQVVVLPSTPEQVAAVVRCAAEYDLPVVARGAGTGIAGGAIPLRGGVLLSTARLDRIEEIDTANRWAVVQAGVVNSDLNARLAPLGYQFAPDPSSQRASTIGGNLATNAGGPHCLKYGVTTNHILALEIVLHDGTLLWTGDGVAEAAGYDLTGLIVGSEGTFGVVTRAKVRLTRLPEANRVVLALFPGVVQASAAVSQIIAAGHAPTSLEVMDHNAIRAVNTAYGLGLPEAEGTTLLIIEVDGVLDGLDAALSEVLDICEEQQAFDLRPARTAEEQARVWVARKSVAGAIGRLAPAYYLVDAVVPRTRLPMMMEHVERLRREHRLEVCNVFHAGDGNLHPLVLYDPRDPDQVERAHAIAVGVLRLSIEQGGVISGEHGIGVEKQEYLPLLMSEADLALHATVYNVFNPADRFNPAKIFPADISPRALAEQRRERIVHRRPTTDNRRPTEISYQSVVGRQSSVVIHYEPHDQTIAVAAEMSMAALEELLAANNQFFPITVADPANTTIGEIIANGIDDPRRLGYGSLRDLVLGLGIIEPDGTRVQLGAQVVKNVTGYDLVKLYVGSRNSLGSIASAALRIFPVPQQSATVLIELPTQANAMALLAELAETRLMPVAIEYLERVENREKRATTLAIRLEGTEPSLARHRRELGERAKHHAALALQELVANQHISFWRSIAAHTAATIAHPDEALLRISVPPGELAAAVDSLHTLAATASMQLNTLCARAMHGVIYARVHGSAAALSQLQNSLITRWTHSHILACDPARAPGLPTWGGNLPTRGLMEALREAIRRDV